MSDEPASQCTPGRKPPVGFNAALYRDRAVALTEQIAQAREALERIMSAVGNDPVAQRMRDIAREALSKRADDAAAKPEPVERVFAKLYCDRCGFSCDPRAMPVTFLQRWRESEEGDLCPKCAGTER